MHNVAHVLTVIRETLGLPELEFNENGHAELIFDDAFSGFLSRVDENNLEFSFFLPELDLTEPGTLQALLTANCLGQATGAGRLAIDESKMQALYCERWRASDVRAEKIPELLIDMVSTAGFWLAEGTATLRQEAFERSRHTAQKTPKLISGEDEVMFTV